MGCGGGVWWWGGCVGWWGGCVGWWGAVGLGWSCSFLVITVSHPTFCSGGIGVGVDDGIGL